MFVKLTDAQQALVDDYTKRAAAHQIGVVRVYKEMGLNVMIECTMPLGTQTIMNLTRFGEMVQGLERAEALKEYLERGGKVNQFDAEVAQGSGLKKSATRGRKVSGGRKAEPISTGDKKFDMYLNALPEPVRVLVVPLGWDPRELYKEYRALKKEGIIAKYATDENRALAAEKAGA